MNKEELLEEFKKCFARYPHAGIINPRFTKNEQAYKQIVALMKKPQITEKWILEWERRLAHYALGLTAKEANREVRTMLKDIGVEIRGK